MFPVTSLSSAVTHGKSTHPGSEGPSVSAPWKDPNLWARVTTVKPQTHESELEIWVSATETSGLSAVTAKGNTVANDERAQGTFWRCSAPN